MYGHVILCGLVRSVESMLINKKGNGGQPMSQTLGGSILVVHFRPWQPSMRQERSKVSVETARCMLKQTGPLQNK